jgi:hypothetical protein
VNEGVDIDQIRRATRSEVVKYELKDALRPGQARLGPREVEIFRPELLKNDQAKPRRVISKEEAGEELRNRPLRGEKKNVLLSEEDELKEDQRDETRLLERSQEEELKVIKEKIQQDIIKAPDEPEKKKIEKDSQDKVVEIKKRHEAEKEELGKRHKIEEEKVTKRKIKKD